MNKAPGSIPKGLKDKLLFTLLAMVIYRAGVAIPVPGVDSSALFEFFQGSGSGIFGLFNTFTGGALERFSIFALGVIPYISASIIFQILQTTVPYLEQLKKEGETGRKKIQKYTYYSTVLLALFQSYGLASWLASSNFSGKSLIISPFVGFVPFPIIAILALTAGTCFLIWLGGLISSRGISNGVSLIIFAGIAASIPSGAVNLWQLVSRGEASWLYPILILVAIVVIIGVVIYFETAQRRILVQYPGAMAGGASQSRKASSYLPLKLNTSGVIPPIFASSLLLFPATLSQFSTAEIFVKLQQWMVPTGSLYNILFAVLVGFFCFFYTEIVFNTDELAENLKKQGGFIPGIRAGSSTSLYVKTILTRVTVVGAVYLIVVCLMPTFASSQFNLPFFFGGTSLLILVGVALDVSQQIQAHMLSSKYDGSPNMGGAVRMKKKRVRY